jgi:hypothetical protein
VSQRLLRDIAIGIAAVFLITVLIYPLIFGTNQSTHKPPPELQLSH